MSEKMVIRFLCIMVMLVATVAYAEFSTSSNIENPLITIRVPYNFQNLHEDVSAVFIDCVVSAGPVNFQSDAGPVHTPGNFEVATVNSPEKLRGDGHALWDIEGNNRSFQGTAEIKLRIGNSEHRIGRGQQNSSLANQLAGEATNYGCIFSLAGTDGNFLLPRTGRDDPEWVKPAGSGVQMLANFHPTVYGRIPR